MSTLILTILIFLLFLVPTLIPMFEKEKEILDKPISIKSIFPDPILADYILKEINKNIGAFKANTDAVIVKKDIQNITKINAENMGITNIRRGLEYFDNSKEWNLAHNLIEQLPDFDNLPQNLNCIDLSYNKITEKWQNIPGVMLDLSFNSGKQTHQSVYYSKK